MRSQTRAISAQVGAAFRAASRLLGVLLCLAALHTGCSSQPDTPATGALAYFRLDDTDTRSSQNLTPAMEMFVDQEGTWRIDNLLAADTPPPFTPLGTPSLNLGFVDDPVWLRFTLRNGSGRDQRYFLEITNPRLARVEFYHQQAEGRIVVASSGVTVTATERAVFHTMPAFPIDLASGAAQTYYVHIENSGSLRLSAVLWHADQFAMHGVRARASTFMMIGSLLAMTIYHLIIFLMLRERAYFYLALMTLLFGFYQLARTGLGALMYWPDAPYWSTHSVVTLIMMVTASATFFVDAFLEAPKKNPRLSVFLRLLGWANVISGLFGLTDLMLKYYLSHIVGVITTATVLAVVLMQLRRGSRPARVFIIGWGLTLLSAVIFALLGPGFLPSNAITENFVEVSLISAAVLCAMALADRLKVRELEQRQQLEHAVTERTAALAAALDEVKTLSGLLPICSHCKKIRDDGGYWNSLEKYIYEHTDAVLSHGICPECAEKHYPKIFGKDKKSGPTEA